MPRFRKSMKTFKIRFSTFLWTVYSERRHWIRLLLVEFQPRTRKEILYLRPSELSESRLAGFIFSMVLYLKARWSKKCWIENWIIIFGKVAKIIVENSMGDISKHCIIQCQGFQMILAIFHSDKLSRFVPRPSASFAKRRSRRFLSKVCPIQVSTPRIQSFDITWHSSHKSFIF